MATLGDWFVFVVVVACTGYEMNANGWQNIGPLRKQRVGSLDWEGSELLWISLVSVYWLASWCVSITLTVFVSLTRSCTRTYRALMTPGAPNKRVVVVRLAVQVLVFWWLLRAFRLTQMLGLVLYAAWRVGCLLAVGLWSAVVWQRQTAVA